MSKVRIGAAVVRAEEPGIGIIRSIADRERIIEALVRAGGQEHMVNVSEAHFARLGGHRVNDRDNVIVGQWSLGRLETHLRSSKKPLL